MPQKTPLWPSDRGKIFVCLSITTYNMVVLTDGRESDKKSLKNDKKDDYHE